MCVGNTHEEPSCLLGTDPTLDGPSSAVGWYTTSSKQDYVYAWLTPENTTGAQLQVGDEDSARQATLYQVEGRTMLIAVVTDGNCWAEGTPTEQTSVDAAGQVVYTHSDLAGTCPGDLLDPSRG